MNKSLLAVMAIMPTLLIGCKSETLKMIAFEGVEEITFDSGSDKETANLVTKPSIDNLKFTWKSETESWKSYVSINCKPSGEKGKYIVTFSPTAKYSGKDSGFRLIVSCQKITTHIDLKWNYSL